MNAEKEQDITLNTLQSTEDLETLNDLLTRAMAEKKIQSLIKDDNLEIVVNAIIGRAAEEDEPLLAAAALGRLAAVVRGDARTALVYERADLLLAEEPGSLLDLPDTDGSMKQYAAQMLAHVSAPWAVEYRYREAMAIDTADNARRVLLAANLKLEGNISAWLQAIVKHASVLDNIKKPDARLKRSRRVFGAMRDVADLWKGDVGPGIGLSLASCFERFLCRKKGLDGVDQSDLFAAVDNLVGVLSRVIQLRFSTALEAETYTALEQGKRALGPGRWGHFLGESTVIADIRVALLEASLVLARQYRTQKQVVSVLLAAYTSRPQVAIAIKRHFADARDLDPDVAEWWRSAGDVPEKRRHVEHKVGNNEDSQIGALLIEVESNEDAMKRVGDTVVEYLKISEPVLASTVKRAAEGYASIAQTARRLARMRRLTPKGLKGQRLLYNPIEHEMLGGHRQGIRQVKVVRDGIQKSFNGKIKTLVKPWVQPEDD